jgi:lysophospholipase L1-like esterase
VNTSNQDNTIWRVPNRYLSGEVNQVDDSGWLDEDTTLVTLTIGGNDVGFSAVVRGCAEAKQRCSNGSYVLTRPTGVDPQPLTVYEPYLIQQLRGHLAAVYAQIHAKAPNARVVVVGYPRLFDTSFPQTTCVLTGPDDQQWLNSMADAMIATISGAIADTKAAYPSMAIQLVDPRAAFTGHEVCSNGGQQWINGLIPTNLSASFHPNTQGQSQYANLVNAALP